MKLTESQLQRQIMDFFKWQGWHVRRNRNTPTPTGKFKAGKPVYRSTGTRGMPDLTVFIPVTFKSTFAELNYCQAMDIEVKVKPNKPSAEQLQWIEDMKKINAIAIVAYKLDDVKTALREAGIQYRGGL